MQPRVEKGSSAKQLESNDLEYSNIGSVCIVGYNPLRYCANSVSYKHTSIFL